MVALQMGNGDVIPECVDIVGFDLIIDPFGKKGRYELVVTF